MLIAGRGVGKGKNGAIEALAGLSEVNSRGPRLFEGLQAWTSRHLSPSLSLVTAWLCFVRAKDGGDSNRVHKKDIVGSPQDAINATIVANIGSSRLQGRKDYWCPDKVGARICKS